MVYFICGHILSLEMAGSVSLRKLLVLYALQNEGGYRPLFFTIYNFVCDGSAFGGADPKSVFKVFDQNPIKAGFAKRRKVCADNPKYHLNYNLYHNLKRNTDNSGN